MGAVTRVQCCIAGGGPAGLMLGLLLGRAGVSVLILEKHADFLRDFRGDTIHPSTLDVLADLGLLEACLALPHQEVRRLRAQFGDEVITVADFGHLPTRCRFIAFMPQWDFLDLLARNGARFPGFALRMRAEVMGMRTEGERATGVHVMTADGPLEVAADLVVAADGRGSVLRAQAGLPQREFGAPMDVLWFRMSRRPEDPDQPLARFDVGNIFIMLNRGEHWQCGYVIPKGTAEEARRLGLDALRGDVARLAPFVAGRVSELKTWDDVRLLTVRVDRLERWHRPGLLCIGDAAHAMSPVGGVGINLAIQDAVAAANLLAGPLREGRLTEADLARVQRRRQWPTRVTQALQVAVQRRLIASALAKGRRRMRPPLPFRLLGRSPLLQRLPARIVGLGIRPERPR